MLEQYAPLRAVLATLLVVVMLSPALAQDPFQSAPAPAPAPIPRSPPPARVQAPRLRPPEPEPITAPRSAVPAIPPAVPPSLQPVAPAQTVPAAHPAGANPTLAGQWSVMAFVGCNWPLTWPTKLDMVVAYAGPDQYTVGASAPLISLSGRIERGQVRFAGDILLDRHSYQGTVTSATEMSGTVTNRFGSGPCVWSASKVGAPSSSVAR